MTTRRHELTTSTELTTSHKATISPELEVSPELATSSEVTTSTEATTSTKVVSPPEVQATQVNASRPDVTIRLTNSMSHLKEPVVPDADGHIGMYVCGPTVYDRAHLGNARSAVAFDVLYRLLRHVAGAQNVTFVRNFTDVDDKINAKAAETGRSIGDITAETAQWYLDDMAAVGVLEPNHMPRATAYIAQMQQMIQKLIASGNAYEADGHVLFSVGSYQDYGQLSGRSVEDMIAGARVEVAPYKRDPMDFVLWKPSSDAEPGWDSPWGAAPGRGRPGWHIECSAMAYELLGESFQIHGGGADLMFPHHENEIAQSCCAHPTGSFAKIWLHNEMLQVEGKKMSKSLGNFFTVNQLLNGEVAVSGGDGSQAKRRIPGEVIRLVFLGTHYRKPMDWTDEKARVAEAHLRRWRALTAGVTEIGLSDDAVDYLADDLNTAGVIAILMQYANAIEKAEAGQLSAGFDAFGIPDQDRGEYSADALIIRLKSCLLGTARLLGLLTPELGGWESEGEDALELISLRLADLRNDAMASKDFSAVDALKTQLLAAGVEVRMSKAGIELKAGAGFDAAKLEALL